MDKAGDILKEFFSTLNLEKGEKYAALFSSWRKIAGEDIAAHSRVADLRKGTLIVELDHPGWMQMLRIQHDEILGKLSAKYPSLGIRSVQGRLVKQGRFSPPREAAQEAPRPESGEAPPRKTASPAPAAGSPPELKEAFIRLKKALEERSRKKR
ncbi:MAG: DUF721 domain-containing protein [Spirochaetaceae bacterium]|nr:DUF721 domain-containing protein [Spirochaetaceae bacterium]